MKTLVLGLGNDILCDDGAGLYVARELKKTLANRKDFSVAEASLAGLGLLDLLAGYDKAIVIDAIQTRGERQERSTASIQTISPLPVTLPQPITSISLPLSSLAISWDCRYQKKS